MDNPGERSGHLVGPGDRARGGPARTGSPHNSTTLGSWRPKARSTGGSGTALRPAPIKDPQLPNTFSAALLRTVICVTTALQCVVWALSGRITLRITLRVLPNSPLRDQGGAARGGPRSHPITAGGTPQRTGTTTLRAALRAVLGRGPVRMEGLPIEDPHLPNIFSALEGRSLLPRQRSARQARRGFSSKSDHTGACDPRGSSPSAEGTGSTPVTVLVRARYPGGLPG